MAKTEIADPELECLKLKKQINDNHRLAQTAMADAVDRAVLTGELLLQWKEQLPHGDFEPFVETHFDGSLRTARAYMQATKQLNALPKTARSAVLKQERSISGLISNTKPKEKQGKPGGAESSSETPPVADGPASSAATETADPSGFYDAEETRVLADRYLGTSESAAIEPEDKCPNCAGTKWVEDEFGWVCKKCQQPHGEASGGADDDQVLTLRQKTRKTLEAAMRCFDDLHHVCPSGKHHESIQWCKSLLKLLGEWSQ